MKKQIEQLIREKTIYHGDEGTSGYMLADVVYEGVSKDIVDMMLERIDNFAQQYAITERNLGGAVIFQTPPSVDMLKDYLINSTPNN